VELSPQQAAIVDHRGGHLQVIACAGSGKTESVSRRVAGLIADGARPDSIVAFTFTERAAAELKHRIALRVAEAMGRAFLDRIGPLFVGTIHAYCFRLLQSHVPRYGNYDVLDDHRHAGLLSREYRRLGLKNLGPRHWEPIEEFARTVDVIANELIDPARLIGTPLGECYSAYQEMLDRYHFLTYGQQIAMAVAHLSDPEVFRKVHDPLRYLFVDEYQDINPAQERLIEMLACAPVELCVVGDDDQSIYQWRGADVTNMLDFQSRYPGALAKPLDTNRRSRPRIVETANRFASSISPRLPKTMALHRDPGDIEVVPWKAETVDGEAEQIADTIAALHEKGFAFRDIAVLFRSVRTSAPPLVAALERRDIPVFCGGRTGLFLQPEISLFGEIHAWFVDGDWRDALFGATRPADLTNIVSGLERHFGGGKAIPGLQKYLEDWKKDRLAGRRPVSLVGDFYKLLRRLGAPEIDVNTQHGAARFGSYARFSQVLADFEHVTRRGRYVQENGGRVFKGGQDRGKPYAQQLFNYLLHYARDAYEDFEGEQIADVDAVDILTIHQAKGLEWPIVFMPALVEGRCPSKYAGRSQNWLLPDDVFPKAARDRYEGSVTEERRLFYVGMTRARDCLYLSHFERKINAFRPSRFLSELGLAPASKFESLAIPSPSGPEAPRERLPLTVSFSDIAAFDDCGYRYRLGTILGFQQELAVELGYGKAIHHVLRQIAEQARAKGREPTDAEVEALLEREFYLPFANQPTFLRMNEAARRLVTTYLSDYSDDLHRIWATERPFELHLENGTLSGRADVILHSEGGSEPSLAIVDYKTADDPRREEFFKLQLAVYTAAGRGEGLQVDAAYLHGLKEGNRKAVDISPGPITVAVDRVAESAAGIRSGTFSAEPEPEKCRRCDYRRVCSRAQCDPADL